jgi:hypothetical protein
MILCEEIRAAEKHLFRASARLHELWLYLPEPHKCTVAELRVKLDDALVCLEAIHTFAASPAGGEWDDKQ